MASITTLSNRAVAGFRTLAALPFAAIGLALLAWVIMMLVEWRDANHWVAVSAVVTSVELEEHDNDDDRTTYKTTATYRYEYGGQRYTGHRVAIESGADNVGDFQRRLYRHLRAAQESRTAVTAYVDPDHPRRAVLNRELRPDLLALKGVFALVSGGVGFVLLGEGQA
jgi:hypothetical protein